jgi:hypothetical protein
MIAIVRAPRLLAATGISHGVPPGMTHPPSELVLWIEQHCSSRLAPAAVSAVREGETLFVEQRAQGS